MKHLPAPPVRARARPTAPTWRRRPSSTIAGLPDAAHLIFFQQLATGFNPDPTAVLVGRRALRRGAVGGPSRAVVCATEPPRQELLRRLNRAPGGTVAIVQMRRALLRALPHHPELAAVEADMLHLLSSWFNPGFLEMQQVDWASPARLLEKIIHHEAVHAIDGWDDLRRRLQPDRRCFAFFHPQLPERTAHLRRGRAARGGAAGDRAADREEVRHGVDVEALQGRRVLLDQQLPAGPARRLARQLPDQAGRRATEDRVSVDQDLLHPVADPGLRALARRRRRRRRRRD